MLGNGNYDALVSANRDCIVKICETVCVKILTIWPFKKKLADPCQDYYQPLVRVQSSFLPTPVIPPFRLRSGHFRSGKTGIPQRQCGTRLAEGRTFRGMSTGVKISGICKCFQVCWDLFGLLSFYVPVIQGSKVFSPLKKILPFLTFAESPLVIRRMKSAV